MWQDFEKYFLAVMLIGAFCIFAACCTASPSFRAPNFIQPPAYSILRNIPTPCLSGGPCLLATLECFIQVRGVTLISFFIEKLWIMKEVLHLAHSPNQEVLKITLLYSFCFSLSHLVLLCRWGILDGHVVFGKFFCFSPEFQCLNFV